MRLLRLQLENFRSHDSLDLALSSVDVAAVVGLNGSGKSSILIGLDWALYGGSGADELISRGADQCSATLELEQSGRRWRVNRGRERGKKSWLVVEEEKEGGFTPLAERTLAESQVIVEERITGMDSDAWRASVYSAQGQAGQLAAMTPGKRKELLGGLLGLGQYEGWREKAALDGRLARSEAEKARADLQARKARLDETRLLFHPDPEVLQGHADAAKADAEKLGGELSAAVEREKAREKVNQRVQLVTQLKTIKERAKELQERATRRQAIAKDLEAQKKAAAALPQFQAEKDAARDAELEREAGQDAVKRAITHQLRGETLRDSAIEEVKKAEKRLGEVSQPGALCPTCGQEIEGEHREKAIADIQRLFEGSQEAQALAEQELSHLKGAVEAAKAGVPDKTVTYDEAAYETAAGAAAKVQRREGELEGLRDAETVEDLKADWKRLKAKADELPKEVPPGDSVQQVREQMDTNHRHQMEIEEKLREDKRAREEAKELETQVSSLTGLAVGAELNERAYSTLAQAFSRDGIPAMVLDNAVGAIEIAANDVLEQLGTEMSLRLLTQRTTKSGSLSETLSIEVDDGAGERELSTFSGGEAYRIHIALRLGLATVLSSNSGLEVGCLVIDEVTDLDGAGVEMLAEVLGRLPYQVILISHDADLVDAMPQRIVVERSAGAASSVTVQ